MGILNKLFRGKKNKTIVQGLVEQEKNQDKELNRHLELLTKSDELAKEGKLQEAIEMRKKGLSIKDVNFSFSHYKKLHTLLIKTNSYDEAWALSNELIIKFKDKMHQIRDIQRKQLSKEKKYLEAVYYGVSVILYETQNRYFLTGQINEIDYNKKLLPLLKKSNKEDKFEDIVELIDRTIKKINKFDEAKLRVKLKEILH